MLASKMLLATLKDAPQEAKIASHVLLLRAGLMKNEVAGVYNYLPLGLRVIKKIEDIIREEMDMAGCQEILCSAIQPKELWEESGRWSKYGPELFRFNDRHEREFCLGPTHEEVFTSIARDLIKSPKNLPLNLYQIQTKYRDEVRPRFGLMRGREFIMKDAYSFDKDEAGLDVSYNLMMETYKKIFTRLGLNYRIVLADTGAIGGNGSHQFMALSEVGESDIVYCDCGYAADVEKAEAKPDFYDFQPSSGKIEELFTPNIKTIEDLEKNLNRDARTMAKSIIYKDLINNRYALVMVRADREVNEIKVINALDTTENDLVLATYNEIQDLNSAEGFCGPIGINKDVVILVDEEVSLMPQMLVGANKVDYHLDNVKFGRDFNGQVGFFRKAKANDLCPVCGKPMKLERGIEVGQIFKLGTKYSKPMKANYVSDNNQNNPFVMGCYGIGVTRTLAAIIEQHHDDFGIVWPLAVAPYEAVIVPVNYNDEAQATLAKKIYQALKAHGVETILDDRNAKVGFKMKDWELMGIPFIILCGKRSGEDVVEFKIRSNPQVKQEVKYNEAINTIVEEKLSM